MCPCWAVSVGRVAAAGVVVWWWWRRTVVYILVWFFVFTWLFGLSVMSWALSVYDMYALVLHSWCFPSFLVNIYFRKHGPCRAAASCWIRFLLNLIIFSGLCLFLLVHSLVISHHCTLVSNLDAQDASTVSGPATLPGLSVVLCGSILCYFLIIETFLLPLDDIVCASHVHLFLGRWQSGRSRSRKLWR